jgi:hypothetical protein
VKVRVVAAPAVTELGLTVIVPAPSGRVVVTAGGEATAAGVLVEIEASVAVNVPDPTVAETAPLVPPPAP